MTQDVDIRDIIDRSTSDVPLSELARKGFRQVKVLNKGVINELVEQAVARVMEDRKAGVSRDERRRILEKSRTEFKKLLAKVRSDETRKESELRTEIDALKQENHSLLQKLEERDARIIELEKQTARLEGEVEAFREAPAPVAETTGIEEIRKTIEKLVAKISQGALAGVEITDDEAMLDFVLQNVDQSALNLEHNVGSVAVRKSKAGGVSDSLKKLKSMQGNNDAE